MLRFFHDTGIYGYIYGNDIHKVNAGVDSVRLKQLFIFSHSNSATLQPMTLDAQPMAALISLYPQTNRIDEDDLIKADNAYAASHG